MDVDIVLCGDLRCVFRHDADDILNFLFHPFRIGGGEVDFVDDRNNLEIVFNGEVGIGKRLRFHAL